MNGQTSESFEVGSSAPMYAMYDFEPRTEDEMQLLTGDRITIISREGPDQDWWLGKNERTGEEGLFPPTFIGSKVIGTL